MKLSSVDRRDYITLWTRIVLPDRPVQLPAIFRPSISNIRSDPECWMGPPKLPYYGSPPVSCERQLLGSRRLVESNINNRFMVGVDPK